MIPNSNEMDNFNRDPYCRLHFTDMDLDDTNGVDMTQATLTNSCGKKKVDKPLMERRRRARINQSLIELKALVLDGMKKDPARYSRIEKADVLDMTVVHLKNLQRKALKATEDQQGGLEKYKAGYQSCADEISRYLGNNDSVDNNLRNRIMDHLQKQADKISLEYMPHPPPTTTLDGRPVASISPMSPASSSASSVEDSPKVVYGNVQLVLNAATNAERLRMMFPNNSLHSSTPVRPGFPYSDEENHNVSTSTDDVTQHCGSESTDNGTSSLDGSLYESDDEQQLAVPLNPLCDPQNVQRDQDAPLNLSAANRNRVVEVPAVKNTWRPW